MPKVDGKRLLQSGGRQDAMKFLLKEKLQIILLATGLLIQVVKPADTQYKESEQQYSQEWETQMANDYFQLVEWQDMVRQSIFASLTEQYKGEGEHSFQLMDTCLIQNANGENCELYLIQYSDHLAEEPTWGYFCRGILMNYDQNSSEVLFEVEKDYKLASFGGEYYDIQTSDLDGNGEEDLILLLGEQRFQGAEYYIPDIYCLIGLQDKGKYTFITCHEENWLGDILAPLYEDEHDNRKIQQIEVALKAHFNNSKLDELGDHERTFEDYIRKKEENIISKLDRRSLSYDRKKIWEQFYINEDQKIRKIMVCVESGYPGVAIAKQIAVYVFDYQTEEVEKQIVSPIYEQICNEYGLSTDFEVEELTYKDEDGDGKEDIAITAVFTNGEQGKNKQQSKYRILYFASNDSENELKIFNSATVTEIYATE